MLGGQGWSVAAQDPQDNGVWLTLVNGERTFYILYSAEQRILIGSYPPGSVVIGAKEAKYLNAKELYAAGDNRGAYDIFISLRGFSDVDWLLENDENLSFFYEIGDTVIFGSYPQGENGEVEPIEWIVLDIDENGYYVLISNYGLDAKQYNKVYVAITWENCSLRTWLNDEFYNIAFSTEEKTKIKATHVVNNDNFEYGTSGGNDTEDNVYLLSIDEITQYYGITQEQCKQENEMLYCRPTEFAKINGAEPWDHTQHNVSVAKQSAKYDGNVEWWLRTPGEHKDDVSSIAVRGSVWYSGRDGSKFYTVRPVIRVKFDR